MRSPIKTTRRQLSRAACLTCIRFTLNIHSHHLQHHPPSPPRPRLTFDNMATAENSQFLLSPHLLHLSLTTLPSASEFNPRIVSFHPLQYLRSCLSWPHCPKSLLPSQPSCDHSPAYMTIFYVASENKSMTVFWLTFVHFR